MLGLELLDVALGLILVYLLLSLACSAANEALAGLFNSRARFLDAALKNLLSIEHADARLEEKFRSHPLIKTLYQPAGRLTEIPLLGGYFALLAKPAYIAPKTFAMALLDVVFAGNLHQHQNIAELREHLERQEDYPEMQKILRPMLDNRAEEIEHLQKNLEAWFNASMDRVSGWYKKRTQFVVLLLALCLSVWANADTLEIAKAISNNPTLREALVLQATELAKHEALPGAPQAADLDTESPAVARIGEIFQQTRAELAGYGVPIGWPTPSGGIDWPQLLQGKKLLGLLLTAFAVSFGAPFWFDLLKRVVNIRATGGLIRQGGEKTPPGS